MLIPGRLGHNIRDGLPDVSAHVALVTTFVPLVSAYIAGCFKFVPFLCRLAPPGKRGNIARDSWNFQGLVL